MAVKDINQTQEELIQEFSMLGDDMEMTIVYLMELGNKLEPLDDVYKTDDNLVKGCQSKVWLHTEEQDGRIIMRADSNTDITKGLVYMLVRVLGEHTPEEILNADLYFIDKIGMRRFIGTQRSNGFGAMIKQIRLYAQAYKMKQESEL